MTSTSYGLTVIRIMPLRWESPNIFQLIEVLKQMMKNHPLRQCAKRLKLKADKLLKNITDRKERTDPSIPSNLSITSPRTKLKANGTLTTNGHSNRSVSVLSKHSSPGKPSSPHRRRLFRLDAPFADTPAIARSAEGMSTFAALDEELSGQVQAEITTYGLRSLDERLREYAVVEDFESESESGSEGGSPMSVDGSVVGEKRKLYVYAAFARFLLKFLIYHLGTGLITVLVNAPVSCDPWSRTKTQSNSGGTPCALTV